MSAAHRAMLPREKVVDIRDDFQRKARNSDYEGIEFFTDRHLNFQEVAVGFGDYTILGATFEAGGGPAAAVAIHGTFKERGGDVWVEHFVSDDIELNVGTVGEKFLQAAGNSSRVLRSFRESLATTKHCRITLQTLRPNTSRGWGRARSGRFITISR